MMRKHLSVFMFCIQNKIYHMMSILVFMAVVSIAGFQLFGFSKANVFGANKGDLFLACIFLAAYVRCVLCCLFIPGKKSTCGYTLQRLRISERSVFCWDALTNSLCFLLLWMAEIIIVYVLAMWYQHTPTYTQGAQGILLACYRSTFLHGLIPMAETGIWLRNLLYVICTGILCAYLTLNIRYRQKILFGTIAVLPFIALKFPVAVGAELYMFPVIVALITVAAVAGAMTTAHTGKRKAEEG